MAKVPINPEVLKWALADSGVSLDRLADACRKDLPTVRAWSTGDDKPHSGDLKHVAKALGRAPQFFLLPTPPEKRSFQARFRASPGSRLSDESKSQEIHALRSAQRVQKIAKWAAVAADVRVEFPEPETDTERYAARLREWLDWDTRTQTTATSKSAAFKSLRQHVEDRNVVVLLRDIGASNCRGFSLPDPNAPLALVNKGYELASIRSYTLIHELGHLSRGQEFVCHSDDIGIERWCDRVAAAFLMPRAHLLEYVRSRLRLTRVESTDLNSVRLIANRYKTSWEASARRLRTLDVAGQALVDRVVSTRPEPEESGFGAGGGRTTPLIRLDEYGTAYARLVLEAAEDQRISALDARRYLQVTGEQLDSLAGLLRRGGAA